MAEDTAGLVEEIAGLKESLADLARKERHCQMLRRMLDDLREEYLSLAQSAPDAIVSSDSRGRIVFWNGAAQALFGYEPAEVMGRDVTVLMPERYHEIHRTGFSRALDAGRAIRPGVPTEAAALRKDGSEFPIEITHSSWKRGAEVFFAAFIRDISERKRYEKLREDVERIIRHDLKSPLLGIVGFAKLLMQDESLPETKKEWARLIYDSGMQMNQLLANSQAMLRIHEGSYTVARRPVDVGRLVEVLAKRFDPAMREKGVAFRHRREDGESAKDACVVPGEEPFLDDMLSNLIKNALEASAEGEEVTATIRRDKDRVRVDIHNKGAIPEHIRPHFFKPYVTSKQGGSGLGAHSALLIARAHDGDITFTSEEGEGTHIVITLPAGPGPDELEASLGRDGPPAVSG